MSPLLRRSNRRLLLAGACVVLGAGLLTARLATIQLVDPARYVAFGERQRIANVELSATRGAIVDRNGEDLAVSVPFPTVWADPRVVEDPTETARALAGVLGVDAQTLAGRLSSGAFAYVARQVDPELADQALALDLPGVYMLEEPTRLNPAGEGLARAVLGQAGIDNDGVSGIELAYRDVLSGEPGELVVERGRSGETIPDGVYEVVPAVAGETLVLTLDRSLQFEVEQLLAQTVASEEASAGVVLVAEARTGEILAMANVKRDDDTGITRQSGENLAVTMTYEPGSVVKPFTFATLIEEGQVGPHEWMEVPSETTVFGGTDDEKTFRDTPPRYQTDVWQPQHILAHSSNVGTILAAERATPAQLHDNLAAFGFGRTTGLDFPGESSGILPPLETWSGMTRHTLAIGQGVAVTPVQMLAAYLTLSNGGQSVTPALVRGTLDDEGRLDPAPRPAGTQVVSRATAAAVSELLEGVVNPDATGAEATIPGYRVAGKTGTAWQILDDGTYGTDGNRHAVVSFAGFAPADDPQLVVLAVIDDPADPDASGGRTAAPLFQQVMKVALDRLHVAPTGVDAGVQVVSDTRVRADSTPSPATPDTSPIAEDGA